MTKKEEFLTVIVKFRISPAMAARLDTMMQQGGHKARATLCRSLLLTVINDDAKAHGEKPLDEVA